MYKFTTAAGNHCWKCNYNFEKGLGIRLLIVHNTSPLHHFNAANEFSYVTISIGFSHPSLKRDKSK